MRLFLAIILIASPCFAQSFYDINQNNPQIYAQQLNQQQMQQQQEQQNKLLQQQLQNNQPQQPQIPNYSGIYIPTYR